MRRNRPTIGFLLAAAMLPGCLQIDLLVRVNTDGSATVTERVRFSRRLLDLGSKEGGELKLAPLLDKPAVLERMKHMGKGVRLVSHKIVDAEKGARESVAVFHVPGVNELRYISPFLAYADYPENNVLKAEMKPLYKSRNYRGSAGEMQIRFVPLKRPKSHPRPKKDEPPPEGPSPLAQQVYRDLQPVLFSSGEHVQLFFQVAGLRLGEKRAEAEFACLISDDELIFLDENGHLAQNLCQCFGSADDHRLSFCLLIGQRDQPRPFDTHLGSNREEFFVEFSRSFKGRRNGGLCRCFCL